MNNMKRLALVLSLLCLSGCSSLKDATGEFVSDAIKANIEKQVDSKLAERGLTRDEILKLIDMDDDGKVSTSEALATIKEATKDFVSLEGKQLVDEKLKEFGNTVASKNDLDTSSRDALIQLLLASGTLVMGYLTKQVFSAKNDGKRDARIAILEKVLQKDLNGDGVIGNNVEPPTA